MSRIRKSVLELDIVCFRIDLPGCSLVWLKAPALGAGDREFESHFPDQSWKISSAVEQRPYKAKVKSSILLSSTIYGELAEWLRQQFAKLSSRNGRIGSNPILSAKC